MEQVKHSGRDYRREHRQRKNDHVHRQYNYRGVKRAIGFAVLAVSLIYLVYLGFAAIFGFFGRFFI